MQRCLWELIQNNGMVTYLLKLYVIEIVQLFPNPLILPPTLKF